METPSTFTPFNIGNFTLKPGGKFTLISGPCVIESELHTMQCAERLCELKEKFDFNLIFKASFDKANRTSIDSFRGPGVDEGLRILSKVKETFSVPVLSDVHEVSHIKKAQGILDVMQIPAFLCRQTDLLIAAGESGAVVNIKKGQFLAPWSMSEAINKVRSTGNEKIIATDRGTTFGYDRLISDMRAIVIMKQFNAPVCFDASHSVQLPGSHKTISGGERQFIEPLAKAAIAAGADLIFLETHPDIANAKSDKHSVFPLDKLEMLLPKLQRLYYLTQEDLIPCL